MPRTRYSPAFLARVQAPRDVCDSCRGQGMVIISEWNDQYDRTHASYDTCPDCGGEGEVEIEPPEDCPEAIAQWATFGERDDNYFQQNHQSDKGIAQRERGWDRGERDE